MWMTSDDIDGMIKWGAIFIVATLCGGATLIAAVCCLCGYGIRGFCKGNDDKVINDMDSSANIEVVIDLSNEIELNNVTSTLDSIELSEVSIVGGDVGEVMHV